MRNKLQEAIYFREQGEKETSRKILLELVSVNPNDPIVLYQCAWTHDSLSLEREAVDFYERAIHNGLSGEDLAGAYLGLGSTLRSLGEYKHALEVLEGGVKEFPRKKSLQVFLAMTRYNTGSSKEAVSDLLKLLVETSSDSEITKYKRAITFYAEDLDRVWDS